MLKPTLSLIALTLTSLIAAAPAADVTMKDGPKGTKVVTHEGRSFALSFEANMEKFAAANESLQTGGIVFTGSSSMVGWKTLAQDMAPLPAVNRAFGGSQSPHLWWYADRAILPLRPRLIVAYIGDNDMPQEAATIDNYMKYIRLFLDLVWAQDPATRVAFISNKPSVKRWSLWEKYQQANAALQALCESDNRLTYIDICPTLLDEAGQPRPECFLEDMLHMKPETYVEWTKVVKPVVEGIWKQLQP